jgi:hypothetical protein
MALQRGQVVPDPEGYRFDVAISFAGPQRPLAEQLAGIVRDAGFNVFYDGFYPEELWGKELPVFFDVIYRKKSRFCVMFVSQDYVDRIWTNFERRSAQARALEQKGDDYVLPIKVEDVELPGMPPTIGYLSLSQLSMDHIGELLVRKLGGTPTTPPVPKMASPASKVQTAYRPRIRRHEAEWVAERDTRPVKLDEAKSLLHRLTSTVLDFRTELDGLADQSTMSTLDEITKEAKSLQQHRVYIDGGKAYGEFWRRGDTVFNKLMVLLDEDSRPAQQ